MQNTAEVMRGWLGVKQQHAEDKTRIDGLRRIARESFDAMDRGEYTALNLKLLDGFLDKIDRKVRRKSRAK